MRIVASVCLFVISWGVLAQDALAPWMSDVSAARSKALKQKRPCAIIVNVSSPAL